MSRGERKGRRLVEAPLVFGEGGGKIPNSSWRRI
jgi:hypothetical protein